MTLSSLWNEYRRFLRRTWRLWALLLIAAWAWVAYLAVSEQVAADGFTYVLS